MNAEQIFVDTFDYSPGPLVGKGPPPGSAAGQAAWTNFSGSTKVTAGGLAYRNFAPDIRKATVAGLGATVGDDVSAKVSPVGGSAGGVVWVGFFINQESGPADPDGFAVVSVGTSSVNIGLGMLFSENIYGIDNNVDSPVQRARTSTPAGGAVTWLVTKLDFDTGKESIFVNPPMGSEPPDASASASQAMTSDFQAGGITQVALVAGANQASFNIDELRLGTEFADVRPTATVTLTVPVPRVVAGSGATGVFTLTREGGELSKKLTVGYAVSGSAVRGVNYKALTGTAIIKAGETSVEIKVKPRDLEGASSKVVKLTLRSKPDYTVGTTAAKIVKIVSGG